MKNRHKYVGCQISFGKYFNHYDFHTKPSGSFIRVLTTALVWVSLFFSSSVSCQTNGRYSAPNVNAQADAFNRRAQQEIFNVEFIVALTVNGAFHAIREGREVGDNSVTEGRGNDSSAAGSVILQPGTTVGDLVIINQNEGDSIVVNK